jgi:hypothetical protein
MAEIYVKEGLKMQIEILKKISQSRVKLPPTERPSCRNKKKERTIAHNDNTKTSHNRESNDHRSREATEVGLLQSKIVGFRKCSGENSFSDTAFYKDKDLR